MAARKHARVEPRRGCVGKQRNQQLKNSEKVFGWQTLSCKHKFPSTARVVQFAYEFHWRWGTFPGFSTDFLIFVVFFVNSAKCPKSRFLLGRRGLFFCALLRYMLTNKPTPAERRAKYVLLCISAMYTRIR